MIKKLSGIIAAVLCITIAATPVTAQDSVSKDETVYVNLKEDGSIEGVYVVNSFKLSGQTKIMDYGNYSNIKNLSSDEKPTEKNGFIEFNVDPNEQNFYYQGEMKNANLPWNFKVTYTLNGKKVPAKKLAGASGIIGISLEADTNDAADTYFKENYLAQITATFDSEKCKNIVCEDAMTATVGSNKQLTLMVLPGISKTYDITVSAKNFEFGGFSIAMIKISDGIMGSVDSLKLGINSVSSSISELVSGTGELNNGASDLASGLSLLDSGAQSVVNTVPVLTSGMEQFNYGIGTLTSGLSQISGGSSDVRNALLQLDSSSYEISKGIGSITGGLGKIIENEAAVRNGLNTLNKSEGSINELKSGADTLKNGYKQIETGLNTVAGNADTIVSGMKTLESTSLDLSPVSNGISSIKNASSQQTAVLNSLIAAMKENGDYQKYAQSIETAAALSAGIGSGADALASGAGQLQSGVQALYGAANSFGSAAVSMSEGAKTMYDNMVNLNSGFDKLYEGTKKAVSVFDAAKEFGNGSLKIINGARELYNGSVTLQNGFDKYADGVGDLTSSYMTLDNAIFEAQNGGDRLKSSFYELQFRYRQCSFHY